MRHRKTISFYDQHPMDAEILDYLAMYPGNSQDFLRSLVRSSFMQLKESNQLKLDHGKFHRRSPKKRSTNIRTPKEHDKTTSKINALTVDEKEIQQSDIIRHGSGSHVSSKDISKSPERRLSELVEDISDKGEPLDDEDELFNPLARLKRSSQKH